MDEYIQFHLELPEKAQDAIYWTIKHYGVVTEMCKNYELADEEIERYKIQAIEQEDYVMFFLICVAQTYSKNSIEITEREN